MRCCPRRARTTRSGSPSSRVWIVDPLDGTREFSEPPRDDWAVHVALWQDGALVAGAVAQPGLDQTFSHRRAARRAAAHVGPPAHRRLAHPPAGLRRGAGSGDRCRAGADGLGRRQGHLRGARRDRRLRARRRPVRVGLGGAGRGRGAPRGCTPAAPTAPSCATTRTTCCCPTCWCAGRSWPTRSPASCSATGPSTRRPSPSGSATGLRAAPARRQAPATWAPCPRPGRSSTTRRLPGRPCPRARRGPPIPAAARCRRRRRRCPRAGRRARRSAAASCRW